MMGIMLWQSYRLGEQAARIENIAITTHSSLCTFQADLSKRHAETVKFIKQNPGGFAGIDTDTLQRSADAQQATLDALARGGLRCP